MDQEEKKLRVREWLKEILTEETVARARAAKKAKYPIDSGMIEDVPAPVIGRKSDVGVRPDGVPFKGKPKPAHEDSEFDEDGFVIEFAANDADFRVYWRVLLKDGGSLIVMDADPGKMSIEPFLRVREIFKAVNVPDVFAHDEKLGYVLLEDFGKATYLDMFLNAKEEWAHKAFLLEILKTLVDLQASGEVTSLDDERKPELEKKLPYYERPKIRSEMELFREWYIEKELGLKLGKLEHQAWESMLDVLEERFVNQPYVYCHRDFIVRNLMVTSEDPGVIDFQDAVYGPCVYDVLSLTRDAFISWDEPMVIDMLIRYWEMAKARGIPVKDNIDDVFKDFEYIAVQRHLKVAGIFTRLKIRDGKDKYFEDVPRFLRYLKKTTRRYTELRPLYKIICRYTGGDDQVETGYTF